MSLGAENLLPFKNGSPFPKLSTFPDGDLLPVACRLSGVSWQYQSQDGMKEARGRQTERTAGAGGQMHLWSRVFLPEQTLCRLFFFFFFLTRVCLEMNAPTPVCGSLFPLFKGVLIQDGSVMNSPGPQPTLSFLRPGL